MGLNNLSLPVDIPWKRLATSHDMFAISIDSDLPVLWRSSLAVFTYDPEPDPELTNPDELTSFLKVVATVTGYEYEGLIFRPTALRSSISTVLQNLLYQLFSQYYPAYSALIQVAVFPSGEPTDGGQWSISEYPYLTDFEPKKREVVEMVTDTGEQMSQSANSLNVRKGTTSTNSTENLNIDQGYSFSQSVQAAGYGGSTSGNIQRSFGTQGGLSSNVENLITTDASREKRESFSHTTNLSQLYHVLDSYHAGTNRAIFFLNARPHMVDSPYTFVNGPRRLEGVQEFFLVVRRPKTMPHFCVKAVLETAHLHETDVQLPPQPPPSPDQSAITKQCGIDVPGTALIWEHPNQVGEWQIPIVGDYVLDQSRGGNPVDITFDPSGHTITYTPPKGIDIQINQYRNDSNNEYSALPDITPSANNVDVRVHAYAWYAVAGQDSSAHISFTVTVYTISSKPVDTPPPQIQHNVDLFITSRTVKGCTASPTNNDEGDGQSWVVYESTLPSTVSTALQASKASGQDAVIAANTVSRFVHDSVIRSFQPGQRYPVGKVDFLHAHFVLRELFAKIHPDAVREFNRPLYQVEHLSGEWKQRAQDQAPDLSIWDTLVLPPDDLAARLGMSQEEAHRLQTDLIGLSPIR